MRCPYCGEDGLPESADERDVPTTFDDEQFAEAFDEAVGQPPQ